MKYIIIIITAVLLFLFLRDIDYTLLFDQLDALGYQKMTGLLMISFISYALGTVAWMLCLSTTFKVNFFSRFFVVRQIGESLSLVNPTGIVAGEALKVILLGKSGYSKFDVSQSVIISRFLLWFSYVVLLLFILGFVLRDIVTSPSISVLIYLMASAAGLLLLMTLFHRSLWIYRIISYLSRVTKSKYLQNKLEVIQDYNKQLHSYWLHKKFHILLAIFLFILHYVVGASEYYYILYLLESPIDFISAIYLEIGTSFLKSILSFIPGQIGVEEYGNKYFLSLIGVQDQSLWVTVSILRRIRQLWWLMFGIIAYVAYSKKANNHISNIKLSTNGSTIH